MPDSRRWFLRVEETRSQGEAAIQLWHGRRLPVRLCWLVGAMARSRQPVIETCTILTTKPNSLIANIHDRMPAILRPEDYDLWLDPGEAAPGHVTNLLQPFDAGFMKKYPVSTRVNSPENDDPACAQEIPLPAAPQMLF